jgi:hypothetical protein
MRTLLSAVFIVFCSIGLMSCKKDETTTLGPLSLTGKWELRKVSGGLGGLAFSYAPGNGHTANFTASDFAFYDNSNVTSSGIYTIEKDTTNTPPGNYFLYMNGKKYGLWLEKDGFFYWDFSITDYYYLRFERIQ